MGLGPVLDAYFKSYFGTFVFGALFAGAFLSAKIANVFVGRALQPPVESLYDDTRPQRRVARAETSPTTDDRDAFVDRNLFEAEIEDLNPTPEGPTPEELAAKDAAQTAAVDVGDCNPSRCQPSSMGVNLLATLWSGDPTTSGAIFQSTAGGEVAYVRVGEQVFDEAQVTTVFRNMVCVSRNGTCEHFSLEAANKRVAATPTPKPVAAKPSSPSSNLGDGVRKMGDGEYEIPKQEIDNVLSNLNTIARQARIVPSFKNGKSNGFKLFSIRPNSLYSKIGIQNGDIVQKINGFEMNSPDKALQIYSKLKDADNITVDLVRRGKPVTMSYSIR